MAENKVFYGTGVILFLLVAFFLYTAWIAPFAQSYGYYVGASKLMAQGFTPWADFNISDTPLALFLMSLVYRVVGIQQGSNCAVVMLMLVHLLNLFLLYKLLGKYSVKGTCRNLSLILYILLLFTLCLFLVRLETFAVFFLLLSLLQIKDAPRNKLILAALSFTLAILCKYQILSMLAPVLIVVYYFSSTSEGRGRNCLYFATSLVMFLLIAYLALAFLSGDWLFIRHLDHYVQASYSSFWAHFEIYSIILICQCGILLIQPGILCYKLLEKKTLILSIIAVIAFDFQWLLMLVNTNISQTLFLTPFLIVVVGEMMQDLWGKKKILSVSCFFLILIPSYWGVREFRALQGGAIKADQMVHLEILKECIPADSKISVLTYHANDYEVGPQIYAELPQVLPVNLKQTDWGLYVWDKIPQDAVMGVTLRSADFIFLNAEFLECYPYMDLWSGSHWVDAFSKFIDTHDIQAFGDQFYMITK